MVLALGSTPHSSNIHDTAEDELTRTVVEADQHMQSDTVDGRASLLTLKQAPNLLFALVESLI